MTMYARLLLAALCTTLVLAAAVGTATALRSIGISEEERARSLNDSGVFTFTSTERTPVSVIVRLATTGTILQEAWEKRDGAHIGNVTDCRASEITVSGFGLEGATATFDCHRLFERIAQWNILYHAFLGTLPNINGLLFRFERASFLISIRNVFGMPVDSCLYRGEMASLLFEAGGGLTFNRERALETVQIGLETTLEAALRACPTTYTYAGGREVTLFRVRLV